MEGILALGGKDVKEKWGGGIVELEGRVFCARGGAAGGDVLRRCGAIGRRARERGGLEYLGNYGIIGRNAHDRGAKKVPKVLIVEDDAGIGRLLGALLQFEGYEIEDSKDWDDVLFAVEQIRPDLAIVDVHLRTGDGFDLLRQIRAHADPETARTRVLMMSGMDYRFKCKQTGANGFLEKPFDRMALLEAIRRATESEPVEDLR